MRKNFLWLVLFFVCWNLANAQRHNYREISNMNEYIYWDYNGNIQQYKPTDKPKYNNHPIHAYSKSNGNLLLYLNDSGEFNSDRQKINNNDTLLPSINFKYLSENISTFYSKSFIQTKLLQMTDSTVWILQGVHFKNNRQRNLWLFQAWGFDTLFMDRFKNGIYYTEVTQTKQGLKITKLNQPLLLENPLFLDSSATSLYAVKRIKDYEYLLVLSQSFTDSGYFLLKSNKIILTTLDIANGLIIRDSMEVSSADPTSHIRNKSILSEPNNKFDLILTPLDLSFNCDKLVYSIGTSVSDTSVKQIVYTAESKLMRTIDNLNFTFKSQIDTIIHNEGLPYYLNPYGQINQGIHTTLFSPNDSVLFANKRFYQNAFTPPLKDSIRIKEFGYFRFRENLNFNPLFNENAPPGPTAQDNSFNSIFIGSTGNLYYVYENGSPSKTHLCEYLNTNNPGSSLFKTTTLNRWAQFYGYLYDYTRVKQKVDYKECKAFVELSNHSDESRGEMQYSWYIARNMDHTEWDTFYQKNPPQMVFNQNGNYFFKMHAKVKNSHYSEWFTDSISIHIPSKPIAHFSASDTVICQHLPVTFTNLSTDQQTHTPRPKKYLWDFGDGNTSSETNPVHTYTQPGTYTISLHFQNGYCDSLLVKTHYIHVIDAPKPGFEISDTQGCAPLPIIITDTTWFRVQSKEYYFSDIDQWLPMTQNTFPYTFQNAGVFRVVQKLTGTSGCVIVTDSVWVSVAPGITPQDTSAIHLVDVQKPSVNISWKKHPAAVRYDLFSGNNLNNMSLLTQTPDTFFTHSIASALFYQVQAIDSCANKSVVGNYAKPVWLQGNVRGNNEAAELSHTPYEIWSGTEKIYQLQKFVSGNWNSLRSDQTASPFVDENFVESDSLQSCYRIQITDPNESSLVSHSNVICLDYIPLLYFPTAFSPNSDGLNDVLDLSTVGIASYSLKIYNRWGQKVFEGQNTAWDGTHMGEDAPQGVYMVYIRYTTKSGAHFETSNTVQLVR